MSEPFVGEIRMFAGNFAPRGWSFCDGQLLAVSQNDALFSLLGTIYGGDGRTTFALPDARGRLPIHAGSAPGLSPRRLGAHLGAETVTLTANEVGSHNHIVHGVNSPGDSSGPAGYLAQDVTATNLYADPLSATTAPMASTMIADSGGSQNHDNMMPFLAIHFIIALVGIYPSRQ